MGEGELARITLHECRHTFASLMIAAGVNAKALSTYMGHANISITLDRYGHLMPGNEGEAASLRTPNGACVRASRGPGGPGFDRIRPDPDGVNFSARLENGSTMRHLADVPHLKIKKDP